MFPPFFRTFVLNLIELQGSIRCGSLLLLEQQGERELINLKCWCCEVCVPCSAALAPTVPLLRLSPCLCLYPVPLAVIDYETSKLAWSYMFAVLCPKAELLAVMPRVLAMLHGPIWSGFVFWNFDWKRFNATDCSGDTSYADGAHLRPVLINLLEMLLL